MSLICERRFVAKAIRRERICMSARNDRAVTKPSSRKSYGRYSPERSAAAAYVIFRHAAPRTEQAALERMVGATGIEPVTPTMST